MSLLRRFNILAPSLKSEVLDSLRDGYKIPEPHIKDITKIDDEIYKIQLSREFINASVLTEYLEYSLDYESLDDGDEIVILRKGSKGDYKVDRVPKDDSYIIHIEYFDNELNSDSKARLKMLSDFTRYREVGDFKFLEAI